MERPTKIEPNAGQESVWDYPRPPRLEKTSKRLQIIFGGKTIADSRRAWRVLETSHPPVYYIPQHDLSMENLKLVKGGSWCEWKGQASYYDVQANGQVAPRGAWGYFQPANPFQEISGHVAFYAQLMDACLADGEVVRPQPGRFYGGWITKDVIGPFKGEAGSSGW